MKLHDITGSTFGFWNVVCRASTSRSGCTKWVCDCSCGKRLDVFAKHLLSGRSKSCGCKEPRGYLKPQWKGFGDISGTHWRDIEMSAAGKKKGRRTPVPLEITIQDAWALFLSQQRLCALTGIRLEFGHKSARTASLDRIDSGRGYVPGNIQWVHKDVNRMKNVYDQDYFLEICKAVTRHAS